MRQVGRDDRQDEERRGEDRQPGGGPAEQRTQGQADERGDGQVQRGAHDLSQHTRVSQRDRRTAASARNNRHAAIDQGSITFADNRFYYLTENGTVLLIEPNSKQYTERGRFQHPDRSEAPDWSHPVIANGKLYLRDQGVLLCYDIKAPKK